MNVYMSEEYVNGYKQDVVVVENPDDDFVDFLDNRNIEYIWVDDDIWLV